MNETKNLVPKLRFPGFTGEWEQRKLGEVVDFYNGDRSSRYPNQNDMVADGVPFINAGDLVDGRVKLDTANRITEKKFNELSGAKIKRGDIIYCLRGTLGKNAYVDNFDMGTVASSLVDIRPKDINGKYLFHILNSDIEYRQRVVRDEGAAQPNLSAKNLSEFIIPVPSVEEQDKLERLFSNIDNTIALHQRKLDAMREYKKGLLQKMFPKDRETVPEIRFPGFTGEWEQRALNDIAERVTRKNKNNETDIPLTIASIEGLVDQRTYFGKTIASRDMSGYFLLKKGEFAYNKSYSVGYDYGSIKRLDRYDQGALSTLYICFALKEGAVSSDFMVQYFNSLIWNREMPSICAEGARNHGLLNVPPSDFFKINLFIPKDIREQEKIAKLFEGVDNTIALHQRKLDTMKEYKKGLLQQMFA